MASLLTQTESGSIVDMFENIFDTWSRNIIIYKEAIKTINPSPTQAGMFGFGLQQTNDLVTYTANTGVFPALIKKNIGNSMNINLNSEMDANVYDHEISIKVRRDCRDFLNDGKTERVVVDGNSYIIDSLEKKQTAFGSDFYIFELKEKV